MMEEVSIMMAYDAHILDQMTEEDILVCLVDDSRAKHTVSKKPRMRGSQQPEDPIDRYQTENRRLQQTSLRLEQENDSLAHRLVTSKIALRNALDQAEDRVDDLTKELSQTLRRLQVAEEEKRVKEEEAAMLKEVFRRELEKAELGVKRSTGIVADYRQVCSQLTERLERQNAAHQQEMEAIKRAVQACSSCKHLLESDSRRSDGSEEGSSSTEPTPEGSGTTEPDSTGTREVDQERNLGLDQEKGSLGVQVRDLEKELAQTKLQVVEGKCRIQELEHQRGLLTTDLQSAKNNWFNKTLTTLRSAGAGRQVPGAPRDGGPAAGLTRHRGPLAVWGSRRSLRASDI